jgi:hypothetical protein
MEKALRGNFVTLFPRGYYRYPPPLIAVRGISARTSVNTTEIWSQTIQIQLIPDQLHPKSIKIVSKSVFSFFVALHLGKCN